jgi:aminoglycoside phosphotransferase
MPAFLKVGERAKIYDIKREYDVLLWLSDRLPVPRVLGFGSDAGGDALLISEIQGVPASHYVAIGNFDRDRADRFVEAAASSMRQIHNVPISECPFDQRVGPKLQQALENIRRGFVDESDFETEHAGKTALELYSGLVNERRFEEDLVFTHGDFCFPNIILADDRIVGFVDLGSAGVGDRYQDIALFERSCRHNFCIEIDFDRAFCRGYGLDAIDREKLDYYRKLDELF